MMKSSLLLSLLLLPTMIYAIGDKQPVLHPSFSLSYSYMLQIVFSLLLILGMIILFGLLLKKTMRISNTRDQLIKPLSILQLGNREKIILLDAAGQHLLIGISQNQLRTLHVFSETIDIDHKALDNVPSSFLTHLKTALSQTNK